MNFNNKLVVATVRLEELEVGDREPRRIDVDVVNEGPGRGLALKVEGHGDNASAAGYGVPVLLEYVDGEVRLFVWADINQEEPTHVISLSGAKEVNRVDQD